MFFKIMTRHDLGSCIKICLKDKHFSFSHLLKKSSQLTDQVHHVMFGSKKFWVPRLYSQCNEGELLSYHYIMNVV